MMTQFRCAQLSATKGERKTRKRSGVAAINVALRRIERNKFLSGICGLRSGADAAATATVASN